MAKPLLRGAPRTAASGVRAEASACLVQDVLLTTPVGLLQGVAMTVAVGVLHGVALTMFMEPDMEHARPLHGEPKRPSCTVAAWVVSGAAPAHNLRSRVIGAACAKEQNLDLDWSGILVEAGAIVGVTSVQGFVLTIPAGPLLARQGDMGPGANSSEIGRAHV